MEIKHSLSSSYFIGAKKSRKLLQESQYGISSKAPQRPPYRASAKVLHDEGSIDRLRILPPSR